MPITLYFRTLFLCIYNRHFVKKVRIHHSCSLNPPKNISSTHSRDAFSAHFHLRNDDSLDPVRWVKPSEMPYLRAFSALLLCHQGYALNVARGNDSDSHLPCAFMGTNLSVGNSPKGSKREHTHRFACSWERVHYTSRVAITCIGVLKYHGVSA